MDNNIIIFHHSYLVNNWKEIVVEQLELLKISELYENSEQLHFCCYSEINENIVEFFNLIREFDSKNKCTIVIEPYNDSEKLTLIYIQSFCKNSPEKNVLYFHTKGVTSYIRYGENCVKNILSWRKAMEYFLIENWRKCIPLLNNNDVVGVFYGNWEHNITKEIKQYFSGNFWWSKVSHINNTPDMRTRDNWLDCETLITSIPHVWYNFYSAQHGISLYDQYFDPDTYR
jgi:hypothetical protein